MTIPINPPSIHPQFTPNQQAPGLEVLMRALEQRRELDMRKQKLVREQEEFELNKRLMGTQIEGADLINQKRKADLKKEADDIAAQDQAYQLFTGNLTRADDMSGWGEVIAAVKDAKVGGHLMGYITNHFQTQNLAPSYSIQPSGSGQYVGINPKNPKQTVGTGVSVPREAPERRIPVLGEREKASAFVRSARANQTVNRIETVDPTIAARVAKKVAARKTIVAGLLRRISGASPDDVAFQAEAEIEKSMTPAELEFYAATKEFLAPILRAESGQAVTGKEWMIHAPVFFSMGATTPQVTRNRRKARTARVRAFAAEAGDALPERLVELTDIDLTEYGFGTPQPKPKYRSENPYAGTQP